MRHRPNRRKKNTGQNYFFAYMISTYKCIYKHHSMPVRIRRPRSQHVQPSHASKKRVQKQNCTTLLHWTLMRFTMQRLFITFAVGKSQCRIPSSKSVVCCVLCWLFLFVFVFLFCVVFASGSLFFGSCSLMTWQGNRTMYRSSTSFAAITDSAPAWIN